MCEKSSHSQQTEEHARNVVCWIWVSEIMRTWYQTLLSQANDNLIEVQTSLGSKQPQHNILHHGGEFITFDFNSKSTWWEELDNELSAIQWESLLCGRTPDVCLRRLTAEALQTCTTHNPMRKKSKRAKLVRVWRYFYRRRSQVTDLKKPQLF